MKIHLFRSEHFTECDKRTADNPSITGLEVATCLECISASKKNLNAKAANSDMEAESYRRQSRMLEKREIELGEA